jgi:hypothetical protein
VAKQFTFCPEYKVLCLEQIQYNTLLSTNLIFSSIVVAASCMGMLVIGKDCGFFQDKIKWNEAKPRQIPRGKPGSVCFPPDTGR